MTQIAECRRSLSRPHRWVLQTALVSNQQARGQPPYKSRAHKADGRAGLCLPTALASSRDRKSSVKYTLD